VVSGIKVRTKKVRCRGKKGERRRAGAAEVALAGKYTASHSTMRSLSFSEMYQSKTAPSEKVWYTWGKKRVFL